MMTHGYTNVKFLIFYRRISLQVQCYNTLLQEQGSPRRVRLMNLAVLALHRNMLWSGPYLTVEQMKCIVFQRNKLYACNVNL